MESTYYDHSLPEYPRWTVKIKTQSLNISSVLLAIFTFLLPVVSLSRLSIPPLRETGERVPSTDSSLISLKGLAGTVEEEWTGVDWETELG